MFVRNIRKCLSGAPLWCRLLAIPTNIGIGWKGSWDNYSFLLRAYINYSHKKFYIIGAKSVAAKPSVGVIKLFSSSLALQKDRL
jgi:hypothetical protein